MSPTIYVNSDGSWRKEWWEISTRTMWKEKRTSPDITLVGLESSTILLNMILVASWILFNVVKGSLPNWHFCLICRIGRIICTSIVRFFTFLFKQCIPSYDIISYELEVSMLIMSRKSRLLLWSRLLYLLYCIFVQIWRLVMVLRSGMFPQIKEMWE